MGFSRTWVRNCTEAKAALRSQDLEPALSVFDSPTPGLSGEQVSSQISDACPHTGCQEVKEAGSPLLLTSQPTGEYTQTRMEANSE